MRRAAPLLILLALVVVVAAAGVVGPGLGGLGEDAGTVSEPGVARVLRVVDGDTVRVRLSSGAEEPVRYIGIDTPESVTPDRPVECYGPRASEFNRSLVAGERLRLVSDRERRDRYGRLLAYAYRERDGLFVNAELLRRGFATPLRVEPNVAYAREFARLAAAARERGAGLWSACR